ncbi:universal stress protein [Arachidicoccus terrestris]|uniref:universal stress protein n=1 Tax=Arachidicoccus terrestris TaxID=2875539 RepID=UPI001CC62299|nr:universal stress protein [Arachidicoccus terrestris]UAY56080.1 universal stress protein [Arachidicoccus terrestris]
MMQQEFKRILIAIDDSALSAKAARAGFELAHMIHAFVALVYAVDPTKEVVNADLGITPQESQTVLVAEAERTIDNFIKMYNGAQDISRFTPHGIPEEEILKIARQWKADMIVMGTHGRSAIGRMLSGSKAEYVVRHATVPVLLTPPHMEQ